MRKSCGVCGSFYGRCSECNKLYQHGRVGICPERECIEAQIHCVGCENIISSQMDGVYDMDGKLIMWV